MTRSKADASMHVVLREQSETCKLDTWEKITKHRTQLVYTKVSLKYQGCHCQTWPENIKQKWLYIFKPKEMDWHVQNPKLFFFLLFIALQYVYG